MSHPSELCSAHTFISSVMVGLELSSTLAVLSGDRDIRVEVPEDSGPRGVRGVFPFSVIGGVSRPWLFPGALQFGHKLDERRRVALNSTSRMGRSPLSG